MQRQTRNLMKGLLVAGTVALIAQGCADRRYGYDVDGNAPAPAAQAEAPTERRVARARVAQLPPAPPRSRTVQRPAAQSTASVPQPPQPRRLEDPEKQAPTKVTVIERVLAPNETDAATQVQDETQETFGRDADGRIIVAASNSATPSGELNGRPVFLVDEIPSDVAKRLEEYRLGPGDRLQIKVFGQDEISGEFEISAAGELSFPLIGEITAENLTPGRFNEALTLALQEFFVNPQVTVEVTNYRPFFILGQVGNPGTYKYQPGLNARMAIAIGGGYTRRAKEEPITIFRTDSAGNLVKFDATQDSVILPGDTVEVHRRLF